ncbi:MAG: hypothetical protein HKN23_07950 [Verrucomicrobiales bacterium]|nr:hypothetical protein [Verrucomicrobiales bacterium]
MNEGIYRSAQVQFILMWVITITIPFVVGFGFDLLAPNGTRYVSGFGQAFGIGVIPAVVIHFILRKSFRHVYLIGSAIYASYKKERKLERRRRKGEATA